jgi:hypothetical protein
VIRGILSEPMWSRLFLLVSCCCVPAGSFAGGLLDGDILFQESRSAQSPAIQLATNSRYSHCGILLIKNGRPFVLEAASRVRLTPLPEWIDRGVDGHYVAMRLRNRAAAHFDALSARAGEVLGTPYDTKFMWGDDRLYCSEVVWKLYARAGVELTPLRRYRDYDLSAPAVKATLRKRFGSRVPLDERVVAPVDLLKSTLLLEIQPNDFGRK